MEAFEESGGVMGERRWDRPSRAGYGNGSIQFHVGKKKKKEASWYDIMRRVIRVDPGILELSIHSVSGASGAKFVTREHPEQLAFLP